MPCRVIRMKNPCATLPHPDTLTVESLCCSEDQHSLSEALQTELQASRPPCLPRTRGYCTSLPCVCSLQKGSAGPVTLQHPFSAGDNHRRETFTNEVCFGSEFQWKVNELHLEMACFLAEAGGHAGNFTVRCKVWKCKLFLASLFSYTASNTQLWGPYLILISCSKPHI